MPTTSNEAQQQQQHHHHAAITLSSPSEIVHLEYDPCSLAPPPSDEWTRFVCVSDTHSHTFDVPPGDVLLHSGDLTGTGTVRGFEQTMHWLYGLPHKIKIIIAGNHDLTLHTGWYDDNYRRWHGSKGKQSLQPIMDLLKGPKAVAAGIVYLQSEEYTFKTKEGGRTWSVYGSPWSPDFFNWAFNYEREDGHELVSKFPKTDILLTHGPPFNIFDLTNTRENVGCEDLAARLPALRPRLHLFGHIHEAHGAHIHTWTGPDSAPFPPLITDSTPPSHTAEDVGMDSADASEPEATPAATASSTSTSKLEKLDRTVFVNAANWPAGKKAWRDGVKVKFGGLGFQPVVVDLRD